MRAEMPKGIRLFVRYVDALSWLTGIVAMNLVFLMIAVLLADAIFRNVSSIPLHWGIEFAQFTLAAYYFVGGAFTLKTNAHVRMDLIYERLTDRGRAKMDLATSFCLLFYLVVMLIGSISSTAYAIKYDQRNFSMWNPSMIPIKIIMVGGIILMLLQAVSLIFKNIATIRGVAIR
jgi:TRAP-type mannitol/chloroaromatic compound transport system permease small subunit